MQTQDDKKIWAIVPAAGIGARMGATIAKQYLQVNGQCIIEYAIKPLLASSAIEQVVVAVSATDTTWPTLPMAAHPKIMTIVGGVQRQDTVLSGLKALSSKAKSDDWILVHDAVRPGVTDELLHYFIESLVGHDVGGLLALPPNDTLKRANGKEHVIETIDRTNLWRAQTPQMFRYLVLTEALIQLQKKGVAITDESEAIEQMGLLPKLVPGSACNFKLTQPDDIALFAALQSKIQEIF